MTNSELHNNYQIVSNPNWNNEINGFSFLVTVYDQNPKSEKDFVFIEKSQISNLAMIAKYGKISDTPAKEIIDKTMIKVKARIDLGLFEKGNEYLQCVTTENLTEEFIPIDDESVQQFLLKGLMNIRKSNPESYFMGRFNPHGFCEILKIPFNNYLYNAGILEEEGYIESRIDRGIERGHLFITSSGIRLISEKTKQVEFHKFTSTLPTMTGDNEKYDIAISFAGEDRDIAEEISKKLVERNVRVFYDNYEKSELWGKNLYDYLSSIYGEKSKYCVMLLSAHYEKKLWTNLERRSAQAKAFRENREYILPIRLDDTKITGIQETVGYLDIKSHTTDEIVELIIHKLKKT